MLIKELKELIKSADGVLKIGELTFKHSEGNDIDINFDGDLIQWFGGSENDEDSVDKEGTYNVSATVKELKKRLDEKIDVEQNFIEEKRELEKEIERLKKNTVDNQKSAGKIEAYEKILFDKKITIE